LKRSDTAGNSGDGDSGNPAPGAGAPASWAKPSATARVWNAPSLAGGMTAATVVLSRSPRSSSSLTPRTVSPQSRPAAERR
jgi:hypothetical protein